MFMCISLIHSSVSVKWTVFLSKTRPIKPYGAVTNHKYGRTLLIYSVCIELYGENCQFTLKFLYWLCAVFPNQQKDGDTFHNDCNMLNCG